LLIVVVLLSVLLGWCGMEMRQAGRQRQAVEAIRKAGGVVFYDFQLDESGYALPVQEPPAPAWLRELVGDDFFSEATGVGFNYPEEASDVVLGRVKGLTKLRLLYLSGPQVTDVGLKHLKRLTKLRTLLLHGTQVTDVGLEHLRGLRELESLDLSGTQVTNAGLEHLRGLTGLNRLELPGTQISDAGLQHLGELTGLENLNLHGTYVSDKGVEQLRKALPNCHIDW